MALYLSLILSSFFLSFLELFVKKNKKKYFKIIQKLYIFAVFLLFTFNRKNSDYNNYLKVFNGEKNIVSEKGYLFLTSIIRILGLNHHFIILLLASLMIFVLFYLYKTKYIISFIFLYIFYTFVYDINQIRNFFCILFILIGINFLKKNKNFLYIIFNILAITFQRLGYIYLIFYILQKFKIKTYMRILAILFIIGLFFTPIFEKSMIYLFPGKAIYYFSRKPNIGMLMYYGFLVIDIVIIRIGNYKKIKIKEENLYIKFILFPIIFLPFSCLSIELIERIWRNCLYLKWFYCLKYLKDKNNLKVNILLWSCLIFQMIFFIGVFIIKDHETIINILEQIKNVGFYF